MKQFRARHLLWLITVLAGTNAFLSGCGQSGDLYLPEKPEPQEEKQK